MLKKFTHLSLIIITMLILQQHTVIGQEPYRVGTTCANFLEVGFGSRGIAMGDAVVSNIDDITSIYWNPAGLSLMKNNQAMFQTRPWLVDIYMGMAAVGINLDNIGTVALGITYVDYGEMDVTTMEMQEGTGETFTAGDFVATFSYARRLAQWFSFGASFKYISSKIWQVSASAIALDLGVMINTEFLSPTGEREEGLQIGMSISNYGNRMQYDGMNLLNPIDINPNEYGNYGRVEGAFKLREWELPLLFRVGITATPIVTENTKLRIAIDALHPNNNSESLNVGAIYLWNIYTFGEIFLCAGYKGILMVESQYGLSVGGGITKDIFNNFKIVLDYAYQDLGTLGYANSFGLGIQF
jgi:hypothetical protein